MGIYYEGLSREHAREMVAAAYRESGLADSATDGNYIGLFQEGPGYVAAAAKCGGRRNPYCATQVILPAYGAFWAANPNAAPGAGACMVEKPCLLVNAISLSLSSMARVTTNGMRAH